MKEKSAFMHQESIKSSQIDSSKHQKTSDLIPKTQKSVNFSKQIPTVSDLKQTSTLIGASKTLHNHSMTEQSKALSGGLSMSIGAPKQSLLARVSQMNHSMYDNFNKQ